MKRHIIYIINPIAGTRTKKDLRAFIEKQTLAKGISYTIFPSVVNGDYSYLDDYIKQENVTDVVIAGGDGTVSQAVGSLLHHNLNFGIIPCGSGNGLALTAGISKKPERALETIFNGQAIATDGFTVNGQFACMLCGLGFDAKVAHDFARQTKRGLSVYVKQVIRNFFSAKSYSFEFRLNDTRLSVEAFLVCIANSNQFGNQVTIAPHASLHDGLLDIVIVPSQGKMSMLWQTLKQVRGKNKLASGLKPQKKKGIIYFQAEKITISNPSGALLHIDGDPAETREELVIEIKKSCFRLFQT